MSDYVLLDVFDAKHTQSGLIDMTVRARVLGEEMTIPFSYHPHDPFGLGPAVRQWWDKNPKFPISAADPVVVLVADVKAEAARRIDLIMKDYEQRNALALGQEMVLTYGPDTSTWPADKQAVLVAAMSKWEAIKALRATSDLIEAMSPIPADFREDAYWA